MGVHRRYSETAQRSQNVQVGVFLGYASPRGWALVDRELYLPPSWTAGTEAGGQLGVPAGVRHVTEPELARRMIERVLDSGATPTPWVAAGGIFTREPALARWLDSRGVSYGLAVHGSGRVASGGEAEMTGAPILRVSAGTPLRTLRQVTAARYRVEERFPEAASEMGLDQYQVRRYDAWYRHVKLCMVAGASLDVGG